MEETLSKNETNKQKFGNLCYETDNDGHPTGSNKYLADISEDRIWRYRDPLCKTGPLWNMTLVLLDRSIVRNDERI